MRIGAGIVGILVGILSLLYVGLFGGLLGSATSWLGSGPWARGDSSVNNLGQMISLLSYLSGLLAIAGGIVAFSNTRIGAIVLAASALSHWQLLGFGVIGKVFILPIGIAAILSFLAKWPKPIDRPSALHEHLPERSLTDLNQTESSFDRTRWNALLQFDKDIASAAERLRPLGPKWLEKFASSYLALNDKQYISNIENEIIAAANAEKRENEQLETRREEQRVAILAEQARLLQERATPTRIRRERLWGNRKAKIRTLSAAAAIFLVVVVVPVSVLVKRQVEHREAADAEKQEHMSQCASLALAREGDERKEFMSWCIETWEANPQSTCGGQYLPCGNLCFKANSGQACVNGRIS